MDHDITAKVIAAQGDPQAADDLVRQYLPFIKSETAKFLRRPPQEGRDDELGIAMFAFHEAAMAYRSVRGAFLPLAARAIRNRLIDYHRSESRHSHLLSLDRESEEDGGTLLETVADPREALSTAQVRQDAQEELRHFAKALSAFDLRLTDIAESCPRQERTLEACHRALQAAREQPVLIQQLLSTGKLPIAALAAQSGVERKTLERHRKYLVALLLAYTNGFEIIRGHLRQMQKGGQP